MGIGLHGGAVDTIKWLADQGAYVTATDKSSQDYLQPSIEKIKNLKNIKLVLDQHRMEDFETADLVIKNPGVRWDDKYIQAALDKKVPVEMDSSLFFKQCPTKNIIGITGTKGKTTTSLLVAEMLKKSGKKVVITGVGQEAVMGKLAEVDKGSWVVFELSSWRLSALGRAEISPRVAVVTNIYPDHLNYYPDMRQYIADKENIYAHQKAFDFLVLNWDSQKFGEYKLPESEIQSQRIYFSMEKIDENKTVFIEEGRIKYNFDGRLGNICDIGDIALRGAHNISNALAACAVGIALRVDPLDMRSALADFKGAPHRMELVRTIGNIEFYNDSAATTPQATVAAINSFSGSIFLIAGGSNKNLDLKPLISKIVSDKNISSVFLLEGEATKSLKTELEKTPGAEKLHGVFDSVENAVESAYIKAGESAGKENIVILLSPGCASFGMFKNEFDRGQRFKKAVEQI